jgi:predicted acylesterase/phospholipase RssA
MIIPIIPPRRLLFSGGGIRVISYLGVLQVLEQKQILHHVKEFCGVSAGGLVALMLALGYKMSIMERFCFEYNWENVRSMEPDGALEFLEHYGIDDGTNLERLIQKILFHKGFEPNATFEDLELSGRVKTIRVWASDIQNMRPIEFSAKATPKIQIVFALRASMCIPMYFIPVRHPITNTILVDGGIFDNYPITYLTEKEIRDTLGVVFEYSKIPQEVNDVMGFISLLTSGYYRPSYQTILERYKVRTIIVPCAEFSALNFEVSLEERKKLVATGRRAAELFFSRSGNSDCIRRHSVS